MDERLRKLSELAHMVKDVDLGNLSKLESLRRQIAADSADVRTARRQAAPEGPPSAAHLAGSADLWQDWCRNRLEQLAVEEARIATDVEVQRRIAARAFGRSSVLTRLALDKMSAKPKT